MDEYLKALASAQPTPGGGSAATIVAALGAALLTMVAQITLANEKLGQSHPLAAEIAGEADALRARLVTARARDEIAYREVVNVMAWPRATPEQKTARTAALQRALAEAAAAPLEAGALSVAVLELARRSLELHNVNLISDVACAAEFGASALAASAFNVRINHKFLQDQHLIAKQETVLRRYEDLAAGAMPSIRLEVDRLLQAS